MAATTAMRFGEIVDLRWKNLDLINKLVTIETSKNGDRRIVPLSDQLRMILEAQSASKDAEDYLFPAKNPAKRHPSSMIRKAFLKPYKRRGSEASNFMI